MEVVRYFNKKPIKFYISTDGVYFQNDSLSKATRINHSRIIDHWLLYFQRYDNKAGIKHRSEFDKKLSWYFKIEIIYDYIEKRKFPSALIEALWLWLEDRQYENSMREAV